MPRNGRIVEAEVVGNRGRSSILMPLEETIGLRAGCLVKTLPLPLPAPVGMPLLVRVIDANGKPLDGKGPIRLVRAEMQHVFQ